MSDKRTFQGLRVGQYVLTLPERGLLVSIIEGIDTLPTRDADPHVRREAREALARGLDKFSDAELFDIIQRAGDAEVDCEVSPFFHTLCNLKLFYQRPSHAHVQRAEG